jgi:hypothetical protein
MHPRPSLILAPTVTKLPPDVRGAVLLTGSHGGRYAGCCALLAGVRAAIFHDAGIGRDEAGIGALALFAALGVPAAAVSHETARIGDAGDMRARGRISRVNDAAAALGVAPGMGCEDAALWLERAPPRKYRAPDVEEEARLALDLPGAARPVVLIDSASLVRPQEDAGAILVTASHGGLVGGDPAMALRADGYAAVFNDAGIGIERAGLGRLPALHARGIAAVTAAASSARIGEARSTFEDGIVSAVNATAAARGAEPGARVREVVLRWARG